MSEISVSERRLSAALDRIDQLLEAGPSRHVVPSRDDGGDDSGLRSRLDEVLAENSRLKAELSTAETTAPAAADAEDGRLASAVEQAVRLAAANDDLASANRALIEAASGQGDMIEAASVALEAEIEALRAARAAEIAQLGDIMVELERLLADGRGAAEDLGIAEHTGDDYQDEGR
ncbi:hypothetical protein H4P12_03120 [Paracoccus sp. 11-3]|uniref:Uncharacterized protein n=1 Tax=Paracoccus amoyensis TaxID=2760093 RepID=A0A926JBW4_9RHOB|nr:hypothetical protein [Paracoccus amoyensis]MBC9245724.1 hypothetical protein [Paracoccus amoyensis]